MPSDHVFVSILNKMPFGCWVQFVDPKRKSFQDTQFEYQNHPEIQKDGKIQTQNDVKSTTNQQLLCY